MSRNLDYTNTIDNKEDEDEEQVLQFAITFVLLSSYNNNAMHDFELFHCIAANMDNSMPIAIA